MSNKYEDLIKNARMNADCGENMSPAEVTTLLNVVETTLSALAAENAELKDEISNITFMRDDDFFGSTQRAQEVMGRLVNVKTPATDAFLAEVRAQGVEMAACALDDVNQFNYANMLDDLAQKIRKGVQS
ncbi:hypothetical protein V6177_24105 [Enterobacter chengduensis]|uniref:hypothetical protein n=1 Tax=Enterobacter chengduensis TaxID=2494701 RepID=UPI003B983359